MSNAVLNMLINELATIVEKMQDIIARSGDGTVGGIERIGETDNFHKHQDEFKTVWHTAVPLAAAMAKDRKIKKIELRAAYAMNGMVSSRQGGAIEIATVISSGKPQPGNYYPPEHAAGMVSALRYVLEHE